MTRATGTPIARAARPSPPLAKIQLPTAVRRSTAARIVAMPISQRIETEILLLPISAVPSQLITGESPKYEIG